MAKEFIYCGMCEYLDEWLCKLMPRWVGKSVDSGCYSGDIKVEKEEKTDG